MAKSKTVYHTDTGYNDDKLLTVAYYRTEHTQCTVQLDEERSAQAHRFLVNLCEDQLRDEEVLPDHHAKRLPAPAPTREPTIDAEFEDEAPF